MSTAMRKFALHSDRSLGLCSYRSTCSYRLRSYISNYANANVAAVSRRHSNGELNQHASKRGPESWRSQDVLAATWPRLNGRSRHKSPQVCAAVYQEAARQQAAGFPKDIQADGQDS